MTTIEEAIERDDIEAVERLIDNNCPYNDSITALACEVGNLEVVRLLHESGYPWSSRCVQEAIVNNDSVLLRYLHENGCPFDPDCWKIAIKCGSLEALICLMSIGYMPNREHMIQRILLAFRKGGVRANRGRLITLKYFLVNEYPFDESVALMAVGTDLPSVLDLFVKNGYELSLATSRHAIQRDKPNMVKYLHEQNCPFDEDCVRIALRHVSSEVLPYLIRHNYKVDKETALLDLVGDNVVDLETTTRKRLNILKRLINEGYSLTEEVMIKAIECEHPTVVKHLCIHGCPLSSRVFKIAMGIGNKSILKDLIDADCPM